MSFYLFPFFFLFVAVLQTVAGNRNPDPVTFETSRLAILGADGREHSFVVELALSARQRARGLMFREELANDAGMLFLWEEEAERHMWLKNVHIPLDILFFDKGGRIFRIEHWEHISCMAESRLSGATSPSDRIISSGDGALGALELYGGITFRLGIVAGDRIEHPLLPSAAR